LYLIAQDLDLDPRLAVTVGLLHDSCKSFKNDAMLAEAQRFGIPINDLQRARPSLLHGHVAAELCITELGVDEADVHEAISWHVTGRPGLGPLGKALFFADFSEPLRSHPSSAKARDIYDKLGFDAALRFAAEAKLAYVESKGMLIDPQARAFHAWLVADTLP
jgi:nicotinate-nucleotide adenylyltransferase